MNIFEYIYNKNADLQFDFIKLLLHKSNIKDYHFKLK